MIWKTLLSYAILMVSVLSGTIGYLLWTKPHTNQHANRLLALALAVYAYINFVISLIMNGAIFDAPHFFRTAAPLNYLIGPLLFLYVRASLFSAKRLEVRDLWMFIPALLNVIEWIPFYGQSADYKIAHLQNLLTTSDSIINLSEGWLPPSAHMVICTLINLGYSLRAGWLLWQYRNQQQGKHSVNSIHKQWITTFVAINSIANVVLLAGMPFYLGTVFANYSIVVVDVCAELLLCFYIIHRPTLLYGAFWLDNEQASHSESASDVAQPVATLEKAEDVHPNDLREHKSVSEEAEMDMLEKLALLEHYMATQKPYLQPRLTVANVSVAVEIPPYLLSAMLNQRMGLDFRDYVNAYRVRHLCDLLHSNQYAHLTLEGVAQEAGFSSKTTFYRAFQKHTGLTPAQYFNQNVATVSN